MCARSVTFNVAPRFTPGSPALVNEATARRVAQQERGAYAAALTGAYGETERRIAEERGLRGVVEERTERTSFWDVFDLCTEQRFKRPFEIKCQCGLKVRTNAGLIQQHAPPDPRRRLTSGHPSESVLCSGSGRSVDKELDR